MSDLLKRFIKDERGLETVEWAIIAVILAAGLVTTLGLIANGVQTRFNLIYNGVK